MKKALITILIFIISTSCTTIKIEEGNGHVKIERSFGFAFMELAPNQQTMITDIKSLGFVKTPTGFSVGYHKESFASLSDSCKLIVWIDDKKQLKEWEHILKDIEGICPVITE